MSCQDDYQHNIWYPNDDAANCYSPRQHAPSRHVPALMNRQYRHDIMESSQHVRSTQSDRDRTSNRRYHPQSGADRSLNISINVGDIDLLSYAGSQGMHIGGNAGVRGQTMEAPVDTPNLRNRISIPASFRPLYSPSHVPYGQPPRPREPSQLPTHGSRDNHILMNYMQGTVQQDSNSSAEPTSLFASRHSTPDPSRLAPTKYFGMAPRDSQYPIRSQATAPSYPAPEPPMFTTSTFVPDVPKPKPNSKHEDSKKRSRTGSSSSTGPRKGSRGHQLPPASRTPSKDQSAAPSSPLPCKLNLLVDENKRIDAEKEIAALAETKERKRAEEERRANVFLWAGDISAYPAEATAEFQLPKCEYRAETIHVGRPPKEWFDDSLRINVYAVRSLGTNHIEYKLANGVWSPQEIAEKGYPMKFKDIRPSVFFEGMGQAQLELWVRQLLAQVPGQNDTVMKWTRDVSDPEENAFR